MPADPQPPADTAVTLLGPQRRPHLDAVMASLGLNGGPRVALVNAGWREREPDDGLLAAQAGGNTVNLRLWHRMQEVWEADPELAAADRRRRQVLEEMQELYLLGLDHAMSAILALHQHRPRSAQAQPMAIQDAEQIIREMDERHLARVERVHGEFWERRPPHERPAVAQVRELLARELVDADAVVVPGGHVGVLVGAMHLFNIAPLIRVPVLAWGAGAMALTDRVVLFHDRAAHGPSVAEVFSAGVGLVTGVVALPTARERLDLGNQVRMATLARRFAPAVCLPLDEHTRVDVTAAGELPPDAQVIGTDGVRTARGAA